MLYTRIYVKKINDNDEESDSDSDFENNEEPRLQRFCKNCSWIGEPIDTQEPICVYEKNYNKEFIAKNALKNDYTLYDPTLPRISNIKCINEKCLTNVAFAEKKNLIQLTANKEIANEQLVDGETKFEVTNLAVQKYLKDSKIDNDNYLVLNKQSILIYKEVDSQYKFTSITLDEKEEKSGSDNQEDEEEPTKAEKQNQQILKMMTDKLVLQQTKFQKPNREILFIKYDNDNLKYLYMCSTCKSTWKTE